MNTSAPSLLACIAASAVDVCAAAIGLNNNANNNANNNTRNHGWAGV